MKQIKTIGFTALFALIMVATACKKKPADHIYNSWVLIDVEMPDADSVTLAQMKNANVTYTFKKDGSYTYQINDQSGSGQFEINEAATTLSTTESGMKDMLDIRLTENSLELKQGTEKMVFETKK